MYPPIHEKPSLSFTFDRLHMLWERYPQYREKSVFAGVDALLEEHESYRKDLDEELYREYVNNRYERFLVNLSWADLPYRYATWKLIEDTAEVSAAEAGAAEVKGGKAEAQGGAAAVQSGNAEARIGTAAVHCSGREFAANPYVDAFMEQFTGLDTDHKACFLFPESFVSQFWVIMEVCKRAEEFHPVRNLFPDEEKVHYLAVFDKRNMDDVMLMFHLLYTNTSQDLYGGYSLYDYSLPWYQTHLWVDGTVLRSPFLPDRLAKFQGNLPYYHNPAKTVYVRRNVDHILECGYFSSELAFFLSLTQVIMPLFQWWYTDLALYEEKDGIRTNWRLERTKIRTDLTAEGVIKPKWKHELSLFHEVRKQYPDTLYQYRPDWLGRQSLDLYIPSLRIAIEYQGVQHYRPVEFWGGEEALSLRQELDRVKKQLCGENNVRLIEWPYSLEPTKKNVRESIEACL